MRWSAAGTTDAGGKTSSWCASSASGSSATACPCTGRTWRPCGTANKQLIADWREVLPTMSVCLQVPVVMPGELGGPWAESSVRSPGGRRRHSDGAGHRRLGPRAVTGARTPAGRIHTTHTWHEAHEAHQEQEGSAVAAVARARRSVTALCSRRTAKSSQNRVFVELQIEFCLTSSCPLPFVSSNVALADVRVIQEAGPPLTVSRVHGSVP